ncbi:MAG: site-specific DNA-methyltransferase, partial [Myxococcota bacterium]
YDRPPESLSLVDRPEVDDSTVRVTGPFTFEATLAPSFDWDATATPPEPDVTAPPLDSATKVQDRMLEVLRRSPVLRLTGNRTVAFSQVRLPARALTLSAEAVVEQDGKPQPVAFVFGPEHGAVGQRIVYEAIKEADAKRYTHLYVIGFAIEPEARELIENAKDIALPATYVQATPDLLMGDLLKHMRSSEIFAACGLPEVEVKKTGDEWQVRLLGLDVFDPVTMDLQTRKGDDVPAWFLDTDYDGLCFHACQAFFPRTAAWDNLKRALKADFEDSVWQHLAGDTSERFQAGDHRQIAVKVLDDRGNELLVVRPLR